MAQRDLEESILSEEFEVSPPETFLPEFPGKKAISRAFPEISTGYALGSVYFTPWVDFVLENPDEIWESPAGEEKSYYYYCYFLEKEGAPPAFVVEICCTDDLWKVNNYALVLKTPDLAKARRENLVYSRAKEWDKENFVRTLNDTALQRYDQGKLEEAKTLIDSAITLSDAGAAYLYNNRGLICWKMGLTEQAKRDFLESIALDGENGDPYFNIGLIYFDDSDYPNAQHYLKQAVEVSPHDGQFLTELGHLYLETDQEQEALKLFERAFNNDPSDAQVDFHLGYYFLYKKHNPKNAVKYYDQGLLKDPDDQFALADLAVAHWVLGRRRRTLQIQKTLQQNSALMPYTISRLVYLNMEMENYDAALDYYEQALDNEEPFEPEWLHYHAALVYAKTGRAQQAIDTLDIAVRMGGEAVIKRAMAEKALEQLKQTPAFKKVLKMPVKRKNR